MKFHEPSFGHHRAPGIAGDLPPSAQPLAELRSQGNAALDAADAAAEQALSGNSLQFIDDVVQTGGE